MSVEVEVKDVVANIGNDCTFMQPMYEAITNSFEAGADEIKIKINSDDSIMQFGNIVSFSIEDNGEGFNKDNRKAFSTLWTKNKANLGCKGSGRFTWLNVYKNIEIISHVKKEKKIWHIDFDEQFSPKKHIKHESVKNIDANSTFIKFKNIQKKFYNNPKKGKKVDKRESADPENVKNLIIDYLLIKLFLKKEKKESFKIIISCRDKEVVINNDSIPALDKTSFYVYSNITDYSALFTMYYSIRKVNNDGNQIFLCANHRTTKEVTTSSFGFSNALPNGEKLVCLICSDYFDGKDNNSRNDFNENLKMSTPTLEFPLVINDILKVAKEFIRNILYDRYKDLESMNCLEEEKAIKKAPHLTKFIKENDDVLKSEVSILSKAISKFNEEKKKVKSVFEDALVQRSVSTEEFNKAVNDLSYIAAIELGEYICYRDNIIRALKKAVLDLETNEKFVHDLFVPMKHSYSKDDFETSYMNANLWLLDDKFMTYSNLCSDMSLKAALKKFENKETSVVHGRLNRPDLTIIFSNEEQNGNAILVEFKGPNASKEEKNKSLTELKNDIGYFKEIFTNIKCVWGYIITSFDEDFEHTLRSDSFEPLFSREEEGKGYYQYVKGTASHLYVLDYANIIQNASDRNSTFINILKKHSQNSD